MAFVLQNLAQISGANDSAPGQWTYNAGSDTVATVGGANYFAVAANRFQVGDIIYVVAVDANAFRSVTTINLSVTPNTITTSAFAVEGPIGTADIEDDAVTTAKILNANVTTAKIANLAVTTGLIAANAVTSAKLAASVLQVATGTLTAANWNGMYAAPVQILAATVAGAGNYIEVTDFAINYIYGTTAFAAGGATLLQYGSTVHGAGAAATSTLAAASFSDQTSSRVARIATALAATASTAVANTAIYISNQTAAFTTGDGTFTYSISYRVLPVL